MLHNTKWKKMWLVIPRGASTIKYYKTLKTLHPSVVPISGMTISEEPDNVILLSKNDDQYRIKVEEEDFSQWLEYLTKEASREM